MDEAVLIRAHNLKFTLVEITKVGAALKALDPWAQRERNGTLPVGVAQQSRRGRSGEGGESERKRWAHRVFRGGDNLAPHQGGVGHRD